uniref:Uncharacterized protein n=1 Tax=Onchocerca volvulus TaxID=6282 RepID=A0A8R1TUE5_ONCVO
MPSQGAVLLHIFYLLCRPNVLIEDEYRLQHQNFIHTNRNSKH